jgi:transposase
VQDKDKETQAEIESLRLQLQAALAENTLLRQKLDILARRIFGKKSEQLDAKQLEFLLGGIEGQAKPAEDEKDTEEEPEARSRKRRRKGHLALKTPEDLEVVEEILIPDCVKASPEEWKEIGREVNRRLDYQPAKFFWRQTIRLKYVRRDNRLLPPVIEPAPLELSLGGKVTPGFMAHLLVSRFCDHLPYYRQQALYWRQNEVWISRQQMVEWVKQCVDQLQRVVSVMRDELRQRSYLQVDETPVRYQDKQRAGPCPEGWLWVGLDPGRAVVFHWDQSRGAKGLEKLIGTDFKGSIGVDGHSAYRAYATRRNEVQLVGCWAHARRKFVDAMNESPRIAGWLLNQIGWLFHWESTSKGFVPVDRQRLRASHSRMVVERLRKAFYLLAGRYRPKSLMRDAIDYSINQWNVLTAFLEHGEAELSNNWVENAIRPSALGKRNWLFIGELRAGERSAVVYSLTETCRMIGVNPYEYLKAVLAQLPATADAEVKNLTPANWAKVDPPKAQRVA